MDRKRAQKLLPIIQAFADGKTAQFKCKRTGKWLDCTGSAFIPSDDEIEYRIKPAPVRFYVASWFYPDGTPGVYSFPEGKEGIFMRESYDKNPGFRIDVLEREAP